MKREKKLMHEGTLYVQNSEESKRPDATKKRSNKLALHFDMLKMHTGGTEDDLLADPMAQTEQLLSTGIDGKEGGELKSPLKNERIVCLSSQRDSRSSGDG